jgi:hypothetical protein
MGRNYSVTKEKMIESACQTESQTLGSIPFAAVIRKWRTVAGVAGGYSENVADVRDTAG